MLFTAQACYWLASVSMLVLLLWIRSSQRSSAHNRTLLNSGLAHHKWSIPIFILIVIVLCIILAILSFLPVTNVDYFDDDLDDKSYLCVPLQVPGKTGWGYSTVVVISLWIASVVTITACVFCLIHIQTLKPFALDKHRHVVHSTHDNDMLLKWTMLISYGFDTVLWTLLLTILSITYFSKGNALSTTNTRWGLGYMASLITLLHPVMVFLLVFLNKKKWILQNCNSNDAANDMACPKQIENMQKLAVTWQVSAFRHYACHVPTSYTLPYPHQR